MALADFTALSITYVERRAGPARERREKEVLLTVREANEDDAWIRLAKLMNRHGAETIAGLPQTEQLERFARVLAYLPPERINAVLLRGQPKRMPPALG